MTISRHWTLLRSSSLTHTPTVKSPTRSSPGFPLSLLSLRPLPSPPLCLASTKPPSSSQSPPLPPGPLFTLADGLFLPSWITSSYALAIMISPALKPSSLLSSTHHTVVRTPLNRASSSTWTTPRRWNLHHLRPPPRYLASGRTWTRSRPALFSAALLDVSP